MTRAEALSMYLKLLAEACSDAAMLLQAWRRTMKRAGWDVAKETGYGRALWAGSRALEAKAKEYAECVRERGGLLFAWEGSTYGAR